MKLVSTIIFILICSNTLSAQYFISDDAPFNTIPFSYHQDHFKLKGPIKVYKTEYDTYYFNELGYLQKEVSSSSYTDGASKEYLYNSNKELIQIKSTSFGSTVIYDIVLDSEKRVIKKAFGISEDIFEYDSNGNLLSKKNGNRMTEYRYDNQGRLILEVLKDAYGDVIVTSKFYYETEGDYLKTTQERTVTGEETQVFVSYYQNGIYYGKDKNIVHVFDDYGNELYVDNPSFGKRNIQFYEYFDNANQLVEVNKNHSEENFSLYKCVSGNCQNGWGKRTFENGYYEGFWKNGEKNGFGYYEWIGTGTYKGAWKNGVMEGFGFYKSNNDSWLGEWKNGQLNGFGYIISEGTIKLGIYKDNELIEEFVSEAYGNTTGCVSGNCQDKYGKYKMDNGDEFDGFFKDGRLYMGTYLFANGDSYLGYFNENNERDNFGFYAFSTGEQYQGEWSKGNYNGQGIMLRSNDSYDAGVFLNGELIEKQ